MVKLDIFYLLSGDGIYKYFLYKNGICTHFFFYNGGDKTNFFLLNIVPTGLLIYSKNNFVLIFFYLSYRVLFSNDNAENLWNSIIWKRLFFSNCRRSINDAVMIIVPSSWQEIFIFHGVSISKILIFSLFLLGVDIFEK